MAIAPVNWKRLKEVVADAIDAQADRREAVLLAANDEDASMAAEARKLVAAHDDSSDVVIHRRTDAWLGLGGPDVLSLGGQRFGRYELIRVLGEGAMSAVYLARQPNLSRQVAVKVLRTALPLVDARQRFRREAQALARLKHPNIAVIYEAGLHETNDGNAIPFIAMEYIDGVPLTAYATAKQLDRRGRVKLMIEVALAVQAAHQQAIIHRDLKPANVLVDGDGHPKVLDFGIARIAHVDADRATWQTTAGLLLGTPGYMSPEQCGPNADGVDVRTDVWSLGVMLYELLLGRLPIETRGGSLTDVLRKLESSEPTPPRSVDATISRDLETILLTAVCRDKQRRYPSAQTFADDLRRYLDQLPIEARPPTTLYLLTKFARRNKGLLTTVAAMLVVLAAATLISSIGFFRASHERDRALVAEQRSHDVSRFLLDVLRSPDPGKDGRSVTVLDRIRASLPSIPERFVNSPGAEAEVRSAIGQTLFELAEYDLAREQFERSLAISMPVEGPVSRNVIRERARLVEVVRWQYRPAEAKALCDPLLAAAVATYGREDRDVLPILASAAGIEGDLEHNDAAITAYREVIALRSKIEGSHSDGTLTTMNNLATVLMNVARYGEAAELQREVIAGETARYGPDSSALLVPEFNLAQGMAWDNRHAEALPLFRANLAKSMKTLGPAHDQTLIVRKAIAESLVALGQREEALADYDAIIAQSRKSFGDDHELTLRALNSRAIVVNELGRHDEAIASLRQIVAAMDRVGSSPATRLSTRRNLAIALGSAGHHDEAIATLRGVLDEQRAVGPDSYGMYSTLNCLGQALVEAGQVADGVPQLRQAIDGFTRLKAAREAAAARRGLGGALTRLGQYEEAEHELIASADALKDDVDPRIRIGTARAFVALYDAWGKPDSATPWRAVLATTQPVSPPATQPAMPREAASTSRAEP